MFSTLKTYGIAIAAGAISVLLIAVRVLTAQNSKLRTRVETSQARLHHAKVVMKKDAEIDEQADVHLAEVAKEVEDGKSPSELLNPNKLWNDDSNE